MDIKAKRRPFFSGKALFSLCKKIRDFPLTVYPAKFIAGFVFSRCVILGACAPFGLSAAAAFGTGRGSLFGILGACIGYVSLGGSVNALKYIAGMMLVFCAHFVFEGTSFVKKMYFRPVSVIIPLLCIDAVFLLSGTFSLFELSLYISEIVLAGAFAVFLPWVSEKHRAFPTRFLLGAFSVFLTVAMSLSGIEIFGGISPGRILAFAVSLLISFASESETGTLFAALTGMAVSLSLSSPDFCMIYGVLGVSAVPVKGGNKFFFAAFSSFCALFISVLLNPATLAARSAELLISAFLFVLLADVFGRFARTYFIKPENRRDTHIRTYATARLKGISSAFSSMGTSLDFKRPKRGCESISDVFKRTSDELCKKCTLSDICWSRDFENTKDAVNHASRALRENGVLNAADFPSHFSSRCIHIENFVNVANRELFSMKYRKCIESRDERHRELIRRQCGNIAGVFSELADDICDISRFDEAGELEISAFLRSRGVLCDSAVFRDMKGHLNIHLCGRDLSEIAQAECGAKARFEDILGTRLGEIEYIRGEKLDDIIIRELPRYRAFFGASVSRRPGSEMSGDSGSFFYPENGVLALVLADGMGSGRLAAAESAGNVSLLEKLLKSGLSPKLSLRSLQTALAAKCESSCSFSTIDFLYADMFTGNAEFYKLGAAPTYVKRGKKIRKIASASLPAGVFADGMTFPERTEFKLCDGDVIVITSDGLCEGGDDSPILKAISESEETSPKALSDKLLALAASVYGKSDDVTVVCISICENE